MFLLLVPDFAVGADPRLMVIVGEFEEHSG
jgi:hypothetical protein